MSTSDSLIARFLLALPRLTGDFFEGTVTLMIEHNAEGAFGLVINQPAPLNLCEVLEGNVIEGEKLATIPIYLGGPVETDRLFFLHTPDRHYDGSYQLNRFVQMSQSPALIEDLRSGDGPDRLMAFVGYAGWGPGQLEQELKEAIWLTATFDVDVLSTSPLRRKWRQSPGNSVWTLT